jgi:hypothetical protein
VSSYRKPHNAPFWSPAFRGPHQEVWYLKLNDLEGRHALWLRFTLLVSEGGVKLAAETWAICFRRMPGGGVAKAAGKTSFPIGAFQSGPRGMEIGPSVFSDRATEGEVRTSTHRIRWSLKNVPAHPASFNFVPPALHALGLIQNTAWTVYEDLRYTGWVEVNGERIVFDSAPGMQGHLAGKRLAYGWCWGHCNAFTGKDARPAGVIWDGLNGRARRGRNRKSRALSAMYFHYGGSDYLVNSVWQALRTTSRNTLNDWRFEAKAGAMRFVGQVNAENEDFAGVTYEDTDGSLMYCYNSKVSSMTLAVHRNGEHLDTLNARGTVAFEVVTRTQRDDVPLLI